jgi:hypothetical protein
MDEQELTKEVWGTFSVQDHVRPGAFVAEVLVYDRLLVPVVPTEADGLSAEEAKKEWKRWEDAKWDPALQVKVLEALGDRVEKIPWTAERQAEWKTAMSTQIKQARRDGYFMSGSVLQRFAPSLARAVVAVSAHRSLKALEEQENVRRRRPHEPIEAGSLLAVLGYELLLPSELDATDLGLLKSAAQVGSDETYRRKRAALHQWQERFVRGGKTDAYSIHQAVEGMKALASDLRSATAARNKWKALKWVFAFLGAAEKVAGLVTPVGAAIGGASASLGEFYVSGRSSEPADVGLQAASLIVDAQDRLQPP